MKNNKICLECTNADGTLRSDEEYTKTGRKYGYPDCCIKAFIHDIHNNKGRGKKERIRNLQNGQAAFILVHDDGGSGFLPCEKHANELMKGKSVVDILI